MRYIALLCSLCICNAIVSYSQSQPFDTPTQTYSYLRHFRDHQTLGKYFLFLQAMHNEQQYVGTHIPIYIPLSSLELIQYLYFENIYRLEGRTDASTAALFTVFNKQQDIKASLSFSGACSSRRFKSRAERMHTIITENQYEAIDTLLQKQQETLSKNGTWNKGAVVQLFIPVADIDTVASCTSGNTRVRKAVDTVTSSVFGNTSIQKIYENRDQYSNRTPDIGINTHIFQCADTVHVNILHPMYTPEIQHHLQNEITNLLLQYDVDTLKNIQFIYDSKPPYANDVIRNDEDNFGVHCFNKHDEAHLCAFAAGGLISLLWMSPALKLYIKGKITFDDLRSPSLFASAAGVIYSSYLCIYNSDAFGYTLAGCAVGTFAYAVFGGIAVGIAARYIQ